MVDEMDYMNHIREEAFKKFMIEAGFRDTFAYDYSYQENKFTIYTSRPGIWIGFHGKNIELLKDILSKEVKSGCTVTFKEIRGKFVTFE